MKCRIIAVLGTRPEAIKLALVIHALRQRSQEFETAVVHTGQPLCPMLGQALRLSRSKPDTDLAVAASESDAEFPDRAGIGYGGECVPPLPVNMALWLHCDTTTAFASPLAAYYCKIAVGHIEAGLRSSCLIPSVSGRSQQSGSLRC